MVRAAVERYRIVSINSLQCSRDELFLSRKE
jgi:hypothetical protein